MKVRTLDEPGLSDSERRLIENVAQYGTHVIKVFPPEPTLSPDWAYTIGLCQNFDHPEVVLFGFRPELAHDLLNDVRDLIAEGHRFEDGSESDLLLNDLLCAFREVRPVWHYPYLGKMRWYYFRQEVPVVQMFWPDRENRFPWQPAFDQGFADKQPLLYEGEPVPAGNTEYLRELEERGHWPPPPDA
jgi:hypothetical protein